MNTLCTGKFVEWDDITTTHYLYLLTLWTVYTFSYCSNQRCYWDRIHLCFFCDAPVLILPQGVETKTWTYTCFWKSGIWWTRRCRWKLCYDWVPKCEPLEYTNACALYIPVTPYSAFQWKNNVELQLLVYNSLQCLFAGFCSSTDYNCSSTCVYNCWPRYIGSCGRR